MRLALVSDIHNIPTTELLRLIENEKVDAVLVCGDFIHNSRQFKNGLEFLRLSADIKPTFCSLGNHETLYKGDIKAMVNENGAKLLDSSFTDFNGIKIGGISSGFWYGSNDGNRFNTPPPDLKWLDEFSKERGFKLLLSHHPEYYSRYIKNTNIDLTVSGHAHGGQWRLFGRGVFAPGQGFFPKYTAGVYENRLIISRGLANPHPIPRFNNPTELVIVEIE